MFRPCSLSPQCSNPSGERVPRFFKMLDECEARRNNAPKLRKAQATPSQQNAIALAKDTSSDGMANSSMETIWALRKVGPGSNGQGFMWKFVDTKP